MLLQVGDGKAYIDRELVIKTYQQIQNQTKTAKIIGISQDSVSAILKENHIQAFSGQEVIKKINGHPVAMVNIKTGKIIKTFSDQSDAARWLIKEGKTSITDSQKVSYIIGRVVRGLRKTAYGYYWQGI